MLLYQIGCERRDNEIEQENCTPGCLKPDEQGYVSDPSTNLAYFPTALSLGGGRYDVLVQTGCEGDFLDRYTVDLSNDTVLRVSPVRDSSSSTCNPNQKEVLGSPDLLPMSTPSKGCSKSNLGADSLISFFSFGNSDIYRGRLAFAHATNGSNWNTVKDRFLLYPLCAGDAGVCEKLGVAGAAALDVGDYYYVYPYLFSNPSTSIGTMLLRFEKRCTAPYIAFEQGGGQIFNTVTKTWVDLSFDTTLGYTLEICPTNTQDIDRYLLIPDGTGVAITESPTDGFLLTHKRAGGVIRYLRSPEPTFDGGDAPSYVIDASLLDDFFRYQLCPGGVAPTNSGDPCIYDWDLVNHHAELEPGPGANEYTMFFTRMNQQDDPKFRFSTARMARVSKNPVVTPLLPPSGIAASDGTFANIVRVTWNPVPGATDYEIWRHTVNKPGSATLIATVPQTTQYDDDTVVAYSVYHYWVKAKNSQTTGGFGPSDFGHSRLSCGGLFQEAEAGVFSLPFQSSTENPGTQNEVTFIEVPDGTVSGAQAANDANKASYCFQVPADGTYRIKTRVRAPSHASDSFWVRVDGAPTTPYNWAIQPHGAWVEDLVNDSKLHNPVDPVEVFLSAGDHIVDVFLREDGAQLDSIALESATPQPTCAGLFQEAEDGVFSLPFQSSTENPGTQNEVTFIEVPDGTVSGPQAANAANKASYCFQVPTADTYRIKTRVRAPNSSSDSFWVQVNGAPATGYNWAIQPHGAWVEDFVNDFSVQDPVEVFLSAGDHIVDVFLREDGAQLDFIALESDTPQPTCAGLVQEAEDGLFAVGSLFQETTQGGVTFVEVPDGTVSGAQAPSETNKMSYCFQVPTAGNYRIKTRVKAPNFAADSFWLRVDGSPATPYNWAIQPHGAWVDDFVNDFGVQDPVEVFLSTGDHIVDVFLREDGAQLDSITLESATPQPTCAGLFQQAEDGLFAVGSLFQETTQGGVTFVEVPDGTVSGAQAPNETHKMSYCFQVPTAGTYRIKTRVKAPGFAADSFWVRVNGSPATPYLWVPSPQLVWVDDFVNDFNAQDPVEVILTAGDHIVDVLLREDGTQLDSITLEKQ